MGYTPLSACQCGRYKLLCTCSDEGLVVLICVKITKANKETNPPGETATLRFMWGCAEPPAGSECLFEQQQALVDCSKCTEFNYRLYRLNKWLFRGLRPAEFLTSQ